MSYVARQLGIDRPERMLAGEWMPRGEGRSWKPPRLRAYREKNKGRGAPLCTECVRWKSVKVGRLGVRLRRSPKRFADVNRRASLKSSLRNVIHGLSRSLPAGTSASLQSSHARRKAAPRFGRVHLDAKQAQCRPQPRVRSWLRGAWLFFLAVWSSAGVRDYEVGQRGQLSPRMLVLQCSPKWWTELLLSQIQHVTSLWRSLSWTWTMMT